MFLTPRVGNASVLIGGHEVLNIICTDLRPEARFAGQPQEEVAEALQGRRDRSGAEGPATGAGLICQPGAECPHLLKVELAEGLVAGRNLEPFDRPQGSVCSRALFAVGGFQKEHVAALQSLVFRVVFCHGFSDLLRVWFGTGIGRQA